MSRRIITKTAIAVDLAAVDLLEEPENREFVAAVKAHEGDWDEEAYWDLPPTLNHVDLIDGVLNFHHRLAGNHHEQIIANLTRRLHDKFSRDWSLYTHHRVRLAPGHVRTADLVVAAKADAGEVTEAGDVALLVEVSTGGSHHLDTIDKVNEYEQAGVRRYLCVSMTYNQARYLRHDGRRFLREATSQEYLELDFPHRTIRIDVAEAMK